MNVTSNRHPFHSTLRPKSKFVGINTINNSCKIILINGATTGDRMLRKGFGPKVADVTGQ